MSDDKGLGLRRKALAPLIGALITIIAAIVGFYTSSSPVKISLRKTQTAAAYATVFAQTPRTPTTTITAEPTEPDAAYPAYPANTPFPTSRPGAPLAIYGPIYINERNESINIFGTYNFPYDDVAIYVFLVDEYGDYYSSGAVTLLDDQRGAWMAKVLLHPTKGPDPDEIENIAAIAIIRDPYSIITDFAEYYDPTDAIPADMMIDIIAYEDYLALAYAPVTQENAPFETPTPADQATQNPTQTIREVFASVEEQIMRGIQGNIAFNKPEKMNTGETEIIELLLSPAKSQADLATQIVERRGLATSTAEPDVLIAPSGEIISVETSRVEITPRMKAVLVPYETDAFVIMAMHDNAEQVVTSSDLTAWRWSVTAKEEGSQTLELILYQLIKYDGKEFWHEVETYKADIVVEVTLADRVKSLDWKWIAGFILTLVGSVFGILSWQSSRKKKVEEDKPVKNKKKKKKQP